MGWISGALVYVIIWWLVLFMVLPWGNRPPDLVGEGHATSAPENPRLWYKVGVTTVIAAVVFIIVYFVTEAGWINFRVE
jgi:predicted secreted protein